MPLPSEPRVNSKARAEAVVVLEESVELLEARPPEGRVLSLSVVARRAEEEVGIRITGVGFGAVVGSRRRIVDRGGQVGEVHCVGRTVGQIAEAFVAVAAAKRHLMFAPDFRQVLIGGVDPLIHPVVPLGTAVGHDQVRADGGKTSLAEIIG